MNKTPNWNECSDTILDQNDIIRLNEQIISGELHILATRLWWWIVMCATNYGEVFLVERTETGYTKREVNEKTVKVQSWEWWFFELPVDWELHQFTVNIRNLDLQSHLWAYYVNWTPDWSVDKFSTATHTIIKTKK